MVRKCYRQTLKQEMGNITKNVDYLVNYIFECAKNNIFNENLVKEFSQKGIFLVIQDDIPGSKIRGVFKVHKMHRLYILLESIKELQIFTLLYYMNLLIVKVILIKLSLKV